MGRPKHEPTPQLRATAKTLAGMGATAADIATLLCVSEPTLRKHYRKELDTGLIEANAAVAQSLYQQATSKTKPNVIAAIFWMKTRGGWRENGAAGSAEEPVGKKAQQQAAAKTAVKGRYRPTAPPKLIAANGKRT